MPKLIETIYWEDFKHYYNRAATLQNINIASESGRDTTEAMHVDCPLQHHITIYDTVDREFAGFSNAIQQIWHGAKNPKRWQVDVRFNDYKVPTVEWFFIFMTHRVTGSGASFSYDHGFRNSIIADMAYNADNVADMKNYVLSEMKSGKAIFTSIGNQIPQFPKPNAEYPRGSQLYIAEYMPDLVLDFYNHVSTNPLSMSIREGVDWINAWHKERGLKCFHFVMTAFVMDVAQYFPDLVDPWSRVNYGKNAIEALNLLFKNEGYKSKDFLDAAMDFICNEFRSPYDKRDLERNFGKGLSLEDVACDYVRYVECYVPKGYEYLKRWQVTNNSMIPEHEKHWTYKKHVEGKDV
jgi:hypothetical protein